MMEEIGIVAMFPSQTISFTNRGTQVLLNYKYLLINLIISKSIVLQDFVKKSFIHRIMIIR